MASYESDACGADISCIPEAVRVKGVSYSLTAQTMTVKGPELWDITSPVLYTMVSDILVDGGCVQRVSQKFGFRTIKFKCDSGFISMADTLSSTAHANTMTTAVLVQFPILRL